MSNIVVWSNADLLEKGINLTQKHIMTEIVLLCLAFQYTEKNVFTNKCLLADYMREIPEITRHDFF